MPGVHYPLASFSKIRDDVFLIRYYLNLTFHFYNITYGAAVIAALVALKTVET